MNDKTRAMELLGYLKKPALMEYLHKQKYFEYPASTKYHGSYPGGLVKHCLNVFNIMMDYYIQFGLKLSMQDIIVTSMLHDDCKLGAYLQNGEKYKWNGYQPSGHGMLSIKRIKAIMPLSDIQVAMIKYHMGSWGCSESNTKIKEYPLAEMQKAFLDPRVRLFYLADEMATQKEMVEEKNG